MRKWLHWIFCTVASEHCFPVQWGRDQVFACREGSHALRVWQSNRMQEALLHKYLLFPAALVFLSVGIRWVVQMYRGAALAITRGCRTHHIHWTLKKCNDPCISVLCQGQKRMLHQIYVSFFENLSCRRLNCHVLVVQNLFDSVCPLHFYI